MTNVQDDITEGLKRIGGAWGWILVFGLLGILAGLAVLFFTNDALLVIAVTFGAWLLVSGIFRFFAAFSVPMENGWVRALYAILAVFSVAVGVYLLVHPTLSLLVLTLTIGIFWLFHGNMELFIGAGTPGLPNRGWMIASGLLGIVAGVIIVLSPGTSVLALTLVLGIWLIAYGLTLVVGAFKVRSATTPVRAVLQPRHS